jgi:hypothetical protein
MGSFSDLSSIINRLSGGNSGSPEHIFFWKDGRVAAGSATTPTAGFPVSLWQYNGIPSHGAAPTTGAIPTNSTAGGLLQTNPGGSRQKYLLGLEGQANNVGTLLLYDRLFHIGNLSGTSTSPQTVQGTAGAESPALTRYTTGAGNFAFAEIYTAIGTSATTLTISYTNQSGTTGQTSQTAAIGSTTNGQNSAQRIIPIPLASGDSGIRAVANATLAGSTGTAGAWGITIGHPLAAVSMGAANAVVLRDMIAGFPSLVECLTNACLAMIWYPNSASVPQIFGGAHFAEV